MEIKKHWQSERSLRKWNREQCVERAGDEHLCLGEGMRFLFRKTPEPCGRGLTDACAALAPAVRRLLETGRRFPSTSVLPFCPMETNQLKQNRRNLATLSKQKKFKYSWQTTLC